MNNPRTLVLIKPDAVHKDVWLKIIKVYETHGLRVMATRILSPMTAEKAKELYLEHEGKNFYQDLMGHMTQGTTIALWMEGPNVIDMVRTINGATKPENAAEGTIRQMYGIKGGGPDNAVHGSANSVAAERELDIFFSPRFFEN